MSSPKLDKIHKILESGENFTLTNSQYKQMTGLDFPKGNWYLMNSSAISKKAKEFGYKLKIKERELIFEKAE